MTVIVAHYFVYKIQIFYNKTQYLGMIIYNMNI